MLLGVIQVLLKELSLLWASDKIGLITLILHRGCVIGFVIIHHVKSTRCGVGYCQGKKKGPGRVPDPCIGLFELDI